MKKFNVLLLSCFILLPITGLVYHKSEKQKNINIESKHQTGELIKLSTLNKEIKISKPIKQEKSKTYVNTDNYSLIDNKTIKDVIYSQSLNSLSKKVCSVNPSLCRYSNILANDYFMKKDFHKMYTAVLIHESGNLKYNYNLQNNNVLGYSQINTEFWTSNKLRKAGYDISFKHQLKTNPSLSIKIGQFILFYNITAAYTMNPNRSALLDYSSSYYGLNCPSWYTREIASIYYNEKLLKKVLKMKIAEL